MYGGKERCIRGLVGKPEAKSRLGDPGVDWSIILKWISRKWDWRHGLD